MLNCVLVKYTEVQVTILEPIRLIWRHRLLLWQTSRNDIRSRFAGSTLGILWLVLYPLLLLGAYAIIYVNVFKIRFGLMNADEYVALIFCGLIPFIGFSEALTTGVVSVTTNASLIKNTLYPIELIPVKAVIVSQCTQVVGLGLLLIALTYLGRLTVWALLLVPVWLLQFMFTTGLIWILSSLNVYLRDLQSVMGVVVLILMMLSPIAYTVDMVPPNLKPFLAGNPLYYIISSYQDILMMGRMPVVQNLMILLFLGVTVFFGGYCFFARMKRVFTDNV